jgi:hypothetical protein
LRSGQAENSLCEHDRCVGHGRNLTRGAGSCARKFVDTRARQAPHARASKPRISARRDLLAARPKKASESGHLKRSFSSPPVASAQTCRGLRCGGSLWLCPLE